MKEFYPSGRGLFQEDSTPSTGYKSSRIRDKKHFNTFGICVHEHGALCCTVSRSGKCSHLSPSVPRIDSWPKWLGHVSADFCVKMGSSSLQWRSPCACVRNVSLWWGSCAVHVLVHRDERLTVWSGSCFQQLWSVLIRMSGTAMTCMTSTPCIRSMWSVKRCVPGRPGSSSVFCWRTPGVGVLTGWGMMSSRCGAKNVLTCFIYLYIFCT